MTRKTTRTLLGISLAMIMVLGSVPLGFSEPINQQIQDGKVVKDLSCQNPSHVVVMRTNGQLACVTEKTAQKLGWEIQISTLVDDVFEMMDTFESQDNSAIIPQIEYELPYLADGKSNPQISSEPREAPLFATFELSKFPKVGETAVLRINYTNYFVESFKDFTPTFRAHENLEVISTENLDMDLMYDVDDIDKWRIPKKINEIKPDETIEMSVTFKALKEGYAYFGFGQYDRLRLYVGESQTVLYADYLKANPPPARQDSEENCDLQCELEKGSPEYPPDFDWNATESDSATQNSIESSVDHFAGWTIQEKADFMRERGVPEAAVEMFIELETLREQGYTQKQLEDYLGEKLAKENANQDSVATTQSTSFYVMNGKITNTPAVTDPDQVNKDAVNGLTVCAADWNFDTRTPKILTYTTGGNACTAVSKSGTYFLSPVSANDPDNSGIADLGLLFFASNSEVKVTQPTKDQTYRSTTSFTADQSPGNVKIDRDLTVYSYFDRAVWIVDTMTTGSEVMENNDYRMGQVEVFWEHNKKVEKIDKSITGGIDCTACYVKQTKEIWLDGTDNDNDGREHSVWTQAHEYGHHVMEEAYGKDGWGCGSGGNPGFFNAASDDCAWSEGFATYIAHTILDKSRLHWSTPDMNNLNQHFWLDVEESGQANSKDGTIGAWPTQDNGKDAGEKYQGRIAAMLWDLDDSNVDSTFDIGNGGGDNRSVDTEDILDVFDKAAYADTDTAGFFEGWNKEEPSDDLTNIAKLHHMGFVNSLPFAKGASYTLNQDTSLTITLEGSDDDGDKLTFSITNQPDEGTLTATGTSTDTSKDYTYTPKDGYSGNDSFEFTVNDGKDTSKTATVNLTINKINSVTFTKFLWDSITQARITLSESIDKVFTTQDFSISSGKITSVQASNQDSLINTLIITTSDVPFDTDVTIEYIGDDVTIDDTKIFKSGSKGSSSSPTRGGGSGNGQNDAPTVTITAPTATSFDDGTSVTFTASVSDDRDSSSQIVVSWSSDKDGSIGSGQSVTTSALSVGTHAITATAKDTGNLSNSDTLNIQIIDTNTKPVILLTGGSIVNIEEGTPYNESDYGYSATDNEDGDITDDVVITGSVDHTTPNTYTLSYDVTDSQGLAADTVQRTVTVTAKPAEKIDTDPDTGSPDVPITVTAPADFEITVKRSELPITITHSQIGLPTVTNPDGGWFSTIRNNATGTQDVQWKDGDTITVNEGITVIEWLVWDDVLPADAEYSSDTEDREYFVYSNIMVNVDDGPIKVISDDYKIRPGNAVESSGLKLVTKNMNHVDAVRNTNWYSDADGLLGQGEHFGTFYNKYITLDTRTIIANYTDGNTTYESQYTLKDTRDDPPYNFIIREHPLGGLQVHVADDFDFGHELKNKVEWHSDSDGLLGIGSHFGQWFKQYITLDKASVITAKVTDSGSNAVETTYTMTDNDKKDLPPHVFNIVDLGNGNYRVDFRDDIDLRNTIATDLRWHSDVDGTLPFNVGTDVNPNNYSPETKVLSVSYTDSGGNYVEDSVILS